MKTRKDMPQFNSAPTDSSFEKVLARLLRPTQKDLQPYRTLKTIKKFKSLDSPDNIKPIIISKDNKIIDGHHRWAAARALFGEDVKIPVHRLNLSQKEALEKYAMTFKTPTRLPMAYSQDDEVMQKRLALAEEQIKLLESFIKNHSEGMRKKANSLCIEGKLKNYTPFKKTEPKQ